MLGHAVAGPPGVDPEPAAGEVAAEHAAAVRVAAVEPLVVVENSFGGAAAG